MNSIQFVNQEIVNKRKKRGVIKILLLICAITVSIGNLILILTSGLDEVSLFSGLVIPAWLWFMALTPPSRIQIPVWVPEELRQIDGGVCILIPQIDRGDKFGMHSEQIICDKDRIHNLIFHDSENRVELIGRPVFYFQKGQEQQILDTAVEFDEDYPLQLFCTEETKDAILHILQSGLQRIAERESHP